jgi:HK97 gp10 family phage protein
MRFDRTEYKNLINYLKRFGSKGDKAISSVINKVAFDIHADAKRNSPVTGGFLRSKIVLQKCTERSLHAEVRSDAEYGIFVEYGRKPGKGPPFEPVNLIKEWVIKKGIAGRNSKQLNQIAFLIGRKIAKKGTKAQPYMTPAYEKNKNELIPLLQNEIKKIK